MQIRESLPTVQLAHELPERLRAPWLADPRLDRLSLEAALLSLGGVHSVRANLHAGSVAIEYEYDGQTHHRRAILGWLRQPPPEFLAEPNPVASRPDPNLLRVFSVLAGLALLPILAQPLRRWLTYALIAPTVWEGVQTLSQKGLKIEVLDSLAVSLAAARGEYFTAIATQGLLALGAYLEQRTARHADDLLRQRKPPRRGSPASSKTPCSSNRRPKLWRKNWRISASI